MKQYKNFSIIRKLYTITRNARNILNEKEKLNGSFVDCCDIGCDILSRLLKTEEISHCIVYGDFEHTYEESETDRYGHNWIEVEISGRKFILDPTCEQFDSKKYIITHKDKEYNQYNKTKVVNCF